MSWGITGSDVDLKVGDLVKFKDEVAGMEGLRGIIVAFNGVYPMVAWASPRYTHPVTEVDHFLEVILNKDECTAV